MVRPAAWSVVLLAAGGPAYVALAPASGPREERPPRAAAVRVLDERDADYREDVDPSRAVARWTARIVREEGPEGERTLLRMAFSAVGPRVVPPPGVEGLAGANAITAEEIESILDGGRATARVVRDGREQAPGVVRAGEPVLVPVRRVGADGAVSHGPFGGRPLCGEALAEAALDGEGRFAVDVVVDGRVRARATCVVRGGRARILSLDPGAGPAGGSAP
jgi:hypothetical protein